MRMIDIEAVLKAAELAGKECVSIDLLKDLEQVDAVPVVRCGECRYRELAKVNCKGYTICPASGMEITDDDFCSYGERKEDRK